MSKNKKLSKGLGIDNESELKRTVAVSYVIDTDKRNIKDKVNKSEPKFTE